MQPIGSKTISFSIPMNWLWGIIAFAAGLILAFIFMPDPERWRPVLVFGAAVAAGAAALVTAFNNIDLRSALAEKAETAAQETRVREALEVFYRWNAPTFFYCKKTGAEIKEYFKAHPKVEEQLAFLAENSARRQNLYDLLNTFEALSIAIEKNVVDEETARLYFRGIVVEYWHHTDDVIRKMRAEHNNARLYKEFERLYGRWKT